MGGHPALTFMQHESRTIGGFGRADFSYPQRFADPGEVAPRVLVEAGTASGREPTVIIEMHSFLGQFLRETGLSVGAEDEGGQSPPRRPEARAGTPVCCSQA